MKKLLLTLSILISINVFSNPLDTISSDYYLEPLKLKKVKNENVSTGTTAIVTGLLLTGIGVVKEIGRTPYPTHPTNIDYKPNAPAVLNYMLIGSGLGLTGYGVKLIFTF